MTTTAIILSHFKQREDNLKRIIDDLMAGTVKPDKIIIFIDNPEIRFEDDRVNTIYSSQSFLPIIRFALGSICDTEYCFFLDDDLTVRNKTLDNFVFYSAIHCDSILGLEGSILGDGDSPYSNDTCIKRESRDKLIEVDVVIRTYFVPTKELSSGLFLRTLHPELPRISSDDLFLCLGNKYLNGSSNYVIPVNQETDLTELPNGGVGQEYGQNHYGIRDEVCRTLKNIYE